MVDPNRDTAVFVRALVSLPPQSELRTFLGYGSKMSFTTWAELWGKQNGVHAYYKELTVDEYNDRISWQIGLGKELGEMYAYSAEFGYDGSQRDITSMTDVSNSLFGCNYEVNGKILAPSGAPCDDYGGVC
jgi:hypothetical protein